MGWFEIAGVIMTLAALFAFVNARFLHWPATIGLMAMALLTSTLLILVGQALPSVRESATAFMEAVDFDTALMEVMLGFLLFAGALHIDLVGLRDKGWVIGALATVGVVLSTLVVAALTFGIFKALGQDVSPLLCLLFGALISPTDPIAVLGILKRIGAPKELEIKIAGESLFNDGVGVVVFLGVLEVATGAHDPSPGFFLQLFAREALGGAALGLAVGALAFYMLRSIDHYQTEILVTLAVVFGGYGLASALHISGPLAMVVAGLIVGNHGRKLAMSGITVERLDVFWELIDEILNAVLFVLIGLELLVVSHSGEHLLGALLLIPCVLLARFIAVGIPIRLLRLGQEFTRYSIRILTWAGLRGGISVALALSIPEDHGIGAHQRGALLLATYVVVVFSIFAQGLSLGPLVQRLLRDEQPRTEPGTAS